MDKQLVEVPLSQLNFADWNYKTNDAKLLTKLMNNIKQNGFLQVILIREMGYGKYEVVNGNHRLMALKKLKVKSAQCYNLGAIDLKEAQRIAIETNELRFDYDKFKLSQLLNSVKTEFAIDDLMETIPFSEDEMSDLIGFSDFSFNDDLIENIESFDFDGASIESKPSTESFGAHEKLQFLVSPEIAQAFMQAYSDFKSVLFKSEPQLIDDNSAIKRVTKYLKQVI